MKLCFSPTSPYVRKVRACAITRGIDDLIELVPTDANASPPEFVAINPLSKVPALVTDDGVALFDDFAGYVDFFLLQDLTSGDHDAVRFLMPFDDFATTPIPADVDSYMEFRRRSMEFIDRRNQRITRATSERGARCSSRAGK